MSDCPCGSGKTYEECCGAIIEGTRPAETAEELMRSRYTAYVKGEIGHVRDSLTRKSATDFDEEGARQWSESAQWLGLEIHEAQGGPEDEEGVVEFTARFRQEGQDQSHRERGVFKKEDGQWKYSDGRIKGAPPVVKDKKIGRNDPCPCGSGKKYKKCCGR